MDEGSSAGQWPLRRTLRASRALRNYDWRHPSRPASIRGRWSTDGSRSGVARRGSSRIEAALEVSRPAADAKGIRLETFLDPSAGPVAGDPDRLQQVFWNLLSNVIKFNPRAE
jgi:hypothetical protein